MTDTELIAVLIVAALVWGFYRKAGRRINTSKNC